MSPVMIWTKRYLKTSLLGSGLFSLLWFQEPRYLADQIAITIREIVCRCGVGGSKRPAKSDQTMGP